MSTESLTNNLNDFFNDKVFNIRENFKPTEESPIDPTYIEDYLTLYRFSSFKPLQDMEVDM